MASPEKPTTHKYAVFQHDVVHTPQQTWQMYEDIKTSMV